MHNALKQPASCSKVLQENNRNSDILSDNDVYEASSSILTSAIISLLSLLWQDPLRLEYQGVVPESQQLQPLAWDSYLPMAVTRYKVPII